MYKKLKLFIYLAKFLLYIVFQVSNYRTLDGHHKVYDGVWSPAGTPKSSTYKGIVQKCIIRLEESTKEKAIISLDLTPI
jgi:hypothetical protein